MAYFRMKLHFQIKTLHSQNINHTQTNVHAANMNKFDLIVPIDCKQSKKCSIISDLVLLVDSSIVDGNNGLEVYL